MFANNQIPIGRLSPATKVLYDIAPTPTTADNPLVAPNLNAPAPTFQVIPTLTFRLDHNFNENNKVYLRYTDNIQLSQTMRNSPNNQPTTIAADGIPAQAAGYSSSPIATFSGALGYSHIFSPTFFSETLLTQEWESENAEGGGNPDLNYEQTFGLPNNFGEPGFPNIGTNLLMNYEGTQINYKESQIISDLDENLVKISGRHQMQFGGRYRHERFAYLPDRSSDNISFANLATGLENPQSGTNYSAMPNTGYADADFYLGAASLYSVSLQPPLGHFHDMEFDAYFQDNYHMTKNLTANIGLRYEAHPSPWMKYGIFQGLDLANHAQVFDQPMSYYIARGYTTQAIVTNLLNDGVVFETPQQAGFPDTMIRNYNLTFGPRVALAYQPFNGKDGTVIRGAYGRYIYPVPTRNTNRAALINEPFGGTYTQSYTAPNQSPDGIANYLLRAPQSVVMGTNSSNVVNSSTTNAITPNFQAITCSPDLAPDFVTQTNFTIEQPLRGGSALRVTWLWSHGTNLDHYYHYDNAVSPYIYHMRYGTATPTGSTIGLPTYAATGRNPWDQTKYNDNELISKDGWSNDNALQANYQRLYHGGTAYQITYVWSKALRMGGNTYRDNYTYSAADYSATTDSLGTMTSPYGTITAPVLPPARPAGVPAYAGWHDLNKYEYNILDTAIPKQHITFNGIVDLPFGRGKKFLSGSNRLLDELIGGFQIAGDGSIYSSDFQVNSNNWGPTNPLKTYKHNAPVTDCSSGVCRKSYLWFNGYISPSTINAATKGISGLPSDYVPYQTPIDNTPGTTYYGQNAVQVKLLNGNTSVDTYSPAQLDFASHALGGNTFSKSFINGPINYTVDLSIFKVFPITEHVNLRVNADAFNALNMMGYTNPSSSSGVEALTSSALTPRQLQLTMRLTF